MASNSLKNNRFGGPTHFYRRWATLDIFPSPSSCQLVRKGKSCRLLPGPPSGKVLKNFGFFEFTQRLGHKLWISTRQINLQAHWV